ncbi:MULTISPECIES: hypothetical protein [Streptomyces]|uniref:hypothetical protein n=1 Tax=Streptomyces scabiei TaxID=1930 RepID=UPI000629C062|nr:MULTISPECIES: hypothetical protein [Streptomyces]MBP5891775.1 hypothetical protein [Streptomyces sp. LBUM 1481]MBP5921931.1 hypothetical protein [Streptomyces sp. LBUM 1483]MDX2688715.1 hypothetical protein [Streptomyces scabiei]MDX2752588.1 hypothetical protein [Streptomyces scabiei]MDX2806527.1 hypothetical protein [Streptomyces scabiei]
MRNNTSDGAAAEVSQWAEGAHGNAAHLAAMVGVTREQFQTDPLASLPGIQNYVSRLPLGEFEQSDWITLHTDLVSFLGDVLVRRRGAHWKKTDDREAPTGYRYVLEATGIDGLTHQVEPYDVVMEEFEHLPIDISRMIANAEAVLSVSSAPHGGD